MNAGTEELSSARGSLFPGGQSVVAKGTDAAHSLDIHLERHVDAADDNASQAHATRN